MTKKEKLELYQKAKEAYYNGQEIMTDYEFDQLEKELGLENKSEVGSRHNPSYTVKHPFVMGSLSKVQIHKDKDGNIDWDKYKSQVANYIDMEHSWNVIITPKFDGCSFECEIENNKIKQISSRGDGTWGKDLTQHLALFIPDEYVNLSNDHYILRGEVLVKKSVFEKKYAEQFTNPRSFVSGVLNRDYDAFDKNFQDMRMDLSIVIYDYRVNYYGTWTDHDWTELPYTNVLPQFSMNYVSIYDPDALKIVYNQFAEYRKTCEYALDGIVIKPIVKYRINNLTEHRPKDCVAIKFIPMLEETEVVNITWNLGKTHEFIPIIWVKPVEMDGRMVQKCSGHNLGYLRSKGITVGAKIIMSLAGDIIPFMYKVTKENPDGEIPMPTTYGYYEDDIHLMSLMEMKDRIRMQFLSSVDSLNIPTIGGQTAKDIWNYLDNTDDQTMEFFNEEKKEMPFNILLVSPEEIYFGCGCGKSGSNAKKAFEKILESITLNDIVKSCNFPFCGDKVAEQVVNYLLGEIPNWSHLATEGYLWVYDDNSWQMKNLKKIIGHFGKTFDDFKQHHLERQQEISNQIPVILTGEPNNYKTKGEFLKLNPQYRNTTSWKEVQIVFTNSLDSNTGKMKKAREKGIKIELY
ncbi:hypothetical protein IKN40_05405 [bacterium]|nr:hypothetical protein [bacterium]